MTSEGDRDERAPPLASGQVVLVSLFVTALITAQLTAAKVLSFHVPVSLPVTGDTRVMPGAALAYALTYFATDCYGELYGRRPAQTVVNTGFAMNLVLLVLVWSTILSPAAPSSIDPGTFRTVLGSSTSIVVGSLCAFVVSQNWDVFVFHALRERTNVAHLWLRNVGSTATSQAIDTVIFVVVGFALAPSVLGGTVLPWSVIAALVVGQYILKLLIAVCDTPFVYAVVGFLGDGEGVGAPQPAD